MAKSAASSGKALLVVESPTKAKTIQKYVGSGYQILASAGHVKDLPKSRLGIDVAAHFATELEVVPGKAKVLAQLKTAARGKTAIYLALDPDREGEAIAWHIAEELGPAYRAKLRRVLFYEITKEAVQRALQQAGDLQLPTYQAQLARRILDRLVGYQISPLLWQKVQRGLSAGRVQSVAVRLVVEREAAIAAFVPQEYWKVIAELCTPRPGECFSAEVVLHAGNKFRPSCEAEAMAAVAAVRSAQLSVAKITPKVRKRAAYPPLITSTLQQQASRRFGFGAKKTMTIAQKLYEGIEIGAGGPVGLITYMRTDSTRIAATALAAVRAHIVDAYGQACLPTKANVYRSKKSSQDAHEAIRPTNLQYTPQHVAAYLSAEQLKLYSLIWYSFVASQMTPAIYDQQMVDIAAGDYTLRATGSILRHPGFLLAMAALSKSASIQDADQQDKLLPELHVGEVLTCKSITPSQHFTEPPPRFNESSLIKELEEQGIGRPSTYATILTTIVARGYVKKEERQFVPEPLGNLVTELLVGSFPTILDVHFTASIEAELDDIAAGKKAFEQVLHTFYFDHFVPALSSAQTSMRNVKASAEPTKVVCPLCQSGMVLKFGRQGSFLSCSGYPTCRYSCDFSRNADGEVVAKAAETTGQTCPQCGAGMLRKTGKFGEFYACSQYPQCKTTKPISIGISCPLGCTGEVVARRSKRGKLFYGCSAYPQCTFVAWDKPVLQTCSACQSSYMVEKTGRDGQSQVVCVSTSCSPGKRVYKRPAATAKKRKKVGRKGVVT